MVLEGASSSNVLKMLGWRISGRLERAETLLASAVNGDLADAIDNPQLRIVRFSKQTLGFGVVTHRVEGLTLPVFNPAKTVADCFKFRHKIGMDVALEALRETYRLKKASMNELWEAAKVCVANVMKPNFMQRSNVIIRIALNHLSSAGVRRSS